MKTQYIPLSAEQYREFMARLDGLCKEFDVEIRMSDRGCCSYPNEVSLSNSPGIDPGDFINGDAQ